MWGGVQGLAPQKRCALTAVLPPRLREEASTLRSGWDAQVAQLSKEVTSRDLRVQSLQEEEAELQAQLARCQQDIGR